MKIIDKKGETKYETETDIKRKQTKKWATTKMEIKQKKIQNWYEMINKKINK